MRLRYTPTAISHLENLPRAVRNRIANKIEFYLAQNDPLAFAKHLSGHDLFRYRIGDYRVIFEVLDSTIEVLAVLKRDDAYRDL